jgi:hypothetical protein
MMKTGDQFDQILRAALRDSVRGQEPSQRVRAALLRTVAASRPRLIRTLAVSAERRRVGVQPVVPHNLESQLLADMLHVQVLSRRFVV